MEVEQRRVVSHVERVALEPFGGRGFRSASKGWHKDGVPSFRHPSPLWAGCSAFHLDGTVLGVSVVLAGMPAASVTAILADRYNCDAVFSAKCVVSTTLLSMVTVPLWCVFLG